MTERPILTAAEMRAAEEAVIARGTSVVELMERAGAAVAEAAWRFAGGAPTLILCGPGNNGGDGYVAARLLAERGVHVRVAATGEPRTDAAAQAGSRWAGEVEPLDSTKPAPILIDALFGTGLARPLGEDLIGPLGRLVTSAKASIAVDLPSGVETDSGALLNEVPSFDITVALGSLKPAHRLQPAAGRCGRVVVADIGIPVASSLTELGAPHLPPPSAADHKYSRGMVAVVGGAMSGAAELAARAAFGAGAGYVLLLGAEGSGAPHAIVRRAWSAEALAERRIGALVIGPGLGRDEEAKRRLHTALGSGKPLVIDGDALHLLDADRIPPDSIFTPHEGEFEALFGALSSSKVERAREAAARSAAIIVLKGADTVIAAPDGRASIAPPASPWLSTAGTGDVLAGAIAAMRARGLPPFEAAKAGVWLHARAAERLGPRFIADDLAAAL